MCVLCNNIYNTILYVFNSVGTYLLLSSATRHFYPFPRVSLVAGVGRRSPAEDSQDRSVTFGALKLHDNEGWIHHHCRQVWRKTIVGRLLDGIRVSMHSRHDGINELILIGVRPLYYVVRLQFVDVFWKQFWPSEIFHYDRNYVQLVLHRCHDFLQIEYKNT